MLGWNILKVLANMCRCLCAAVGPASVTCPDAVPDTAQAPGNVGSLTVPVMHATGCADTEAQEQSDGDEGAPEVLPSSQKDVLHQWLIIQSRSFTLASGEHILLPGRLAQVRGAEHKALGPVHGRLLPALRSVRAAGLQLYHASSGMSRSVAGHQAGSCPTWNVQNFLHRIQGLPVGNFYAQNS